MSSTSSALSWPESGSPLGLPTISQIDAELARREAVEHFGSSALAAYESLKEFVWQAWAIVEPGTPLTWNWHLDVLCTELERQIRGVPGYRKLLIMVPPGTMKSLLVSVFAPAWEWLRKPSRRKLCFANDDTLATRDSRRMREVITSDWYRGVVDELEKRGLVERWGLSRDQNQKVNFENTARGVRQCLSLGAAVTGKRGDDIIIDDPLDAKEVVNGSVDQVAKRLGDVANVIEKVLPNRVNNLREARWTIIMQRLAENDPAGRALAEGDWRVVCLQMEFEPANPLNHPDDPRRAEGELLFPELFPREEVEKLKGKLENHYSAQYQQHPLPRGGGPLKRWYWRFWYPRGIDPPAPVMVRKPDGQIHECLQREIPERLFGLTQSWDMAFKDTRQSAYVVGEVWGARDADAFLLDQIRERMDINASIDAVRLLSRRWPTALKKLVEDKANGTAVIGILRTQIPGLAEVNPKGGKEARANAAAPIAKGGNVYLPHPSLYPWVHAFIAECEAVPGGQFWDQVDTFSQYIVERYGDGSSSTEKLATW